MAADSQYHVCDTVNGPGARGERRGRSLCLRSGVPRGCAEPLSYHWFRGIRLLQHVPFPISYGQRGPCRLPPPRQSGAAAPFGVAALSCQTCLSFLRRWSRRGNRGEQAVVRRFMSEVMAGGNLDVADEVHAP